MVNVQQNPGNEGKRLQHPTGITGDPGKPQHDKKVLGDEAG